MFNGTTQINSTGKLNPYLTTRKNGFSETAFENQQAEFEAKAGIGLFSGTKKTDDYSRKSERSVGN
jgi:hypothetical protein